MDPLGVDWPRLYMVMPDTLQAHGSAQLPSYARIGFHLALHKAEGLRGLLAPSLILCMAR